MVKPKQEVTAAAIYSSAAAIPPWSRTRALPTHLRRTSRRRRIPLRRYGRMDRAHDITLASSSIYPSPVSFRSMAACCRWPAAGQKLTRRRMMSNQLMMVCRRCCYAKEQ